MPDRSKIETNFVLSQMMEQFQVNKRNLYIEFIDLEKINDRVPRSVIQKILEGKKVLRLYIELLKDMHADGSTYVKTLTGKTKEFLVEVGLHWSLLWVTLCSCDG